LNVLVRILFLALQLASSNLGVYFLDKKRVLSLGGAGRSISGNGMSAGIPHSFLENIKRR